MRYFGINPHTNDLVALGEHKTALDAWGARSESGNFVFHEQNFIYIVNDVDLAFWRRTIQHHNNEKAWFGINTSNGRLEYIGDFSNFEIAHKVINATFKWCNTICWIFYFVTAEKWKDIDVSRKHESWSKYE